MLKRESYRNAHSPFTSIAPLLDSEFDDVLSEGWIHNVQQPKYRTGISGCAITDIIS